MIIPILLLALTLRLVFLNQSLWLDEAVQAITSQGSFAGIFAELRGDFHPPLYHILMWVWVHLFDSSEIILRLPSVIFGTMTIYIVYLIGKQIFPKKLEIGNWKLEIPKIAMLFLATAPFHIYYSQETRMYAMATFFACLSMYFFVRVTSDQRPVSRKSKSLITDHWSLVTGYILSTTLLLYSDYYGFLVLLSQVIVAAIILKRKASQLLYCYIAILLLFLPCLPLFLVQLKTGSQAIQTLPEWGRLVNLSFLKALPLTFIKFSLGRITIFDKKLYAVIAGILFIIYGGIIVKGLFGKKKNFIHHTSYIILLLWLLVPILSAWLISLFIPNYQPFRLLLVLPAFYLLLAWGVSQIKTTMIRIIVVAVILSVNLISTGVYFFNPYFHREDWRGVVGFIEKQEKGSAAILPSSTSGAPWQYYSSGKVRLIGIASGVKKVTQEDLNNVTIEQFNNGTIYYIRYLVPIFDPQEKISSWIAENGFVKIKEISFNQIPVWEYGKL